MPSISNSKKERIQEQILYYLFSLSPEATFTNAIAKEIARDEEFTKTLLKDLKNKGLVIQVTKSPSGQTYLKRQRWLLSDQTFQAYTKKQQ